MSTGQIEILAAITVYLAAMVHVGFYFSKKGGGDSADEFHLRGRKLGALVTAASVEASDMSSRLFMGLPGAAHPTGIANAGWATIDLAAGTYLNWLVVARCLHRYSVVCGVIAIPDFFSCRHRDDGNILMCIAAIVILILFIPYTASGFKAVGTLLNSLFGVNYYATVIAGAMVTAGYTILGRFMAVSTTDLIQSIVMSIALVIIVFFGIHVVGGWNAVANNARSLAGYLSMTHAHNMADNTAPPYGIITILSTMVWGLGYFGMPHILPRFMAISHGDKFKTSRRTTPIWVVISMFVVILIGIIGNGASVAGGISMFSSSSESEIVIIRLVDLLGRHGIPLSVAAGVMLVGILACTMSMTDSQLLAAASGVSRNLLQDLLEIKMDAKASTIAAHITVVGTALVAVLLAWNPGSSVFTIVSFAWTGSGASLGSAMLFALFWKRSDLKGVLAGIISGGVIVFVRKYGVRPLGGAWSIYELLPAFTVACIAIVAVSLMTEAPSVEICDEYDSVGRQG